MHLALRQTGNQKVTRHFSMFQLSRHRVGHVRHVRVGHVKNSVQYDTLSIQFGFNYLARMTGYDEVPVFDFQL